MAWQGVKAIVLFVCCIGSVLAHEPISTLDRFSGVDYDSSDGEVLAQDRGHDMKSEVAVFCNNNTMKVTLPSGSLSQVKILGFGVSESVLEAPETCGYSLTQGHGHNVLLVDYTGCHVTLKDGRYTLRVLYPTEAGKLDAAMLSCHANQSLTASLKPLDVQSDQPLDVQSDQPLDVQSDQPLDVQSDQPLDVQSDQPLDVQSDQPLDVQSDQPCPKLPLTEPSQSSPSLYPPSLILLKSKPGGCTINDDQKVSCSTSGITREECLTRGCCFDADTSVCYYPMDECTADMNFVFAIHNDFANVPVDPMSFIVAGKTGCKPVIANKDFAIFKFSVTECGTRSFVIGETTIYLAEVQTVIKVRNLKYGMISRDNPIRLMVECRYPKVLADPRLSRPVLASAGYMVMSPSLPPYLLSEGLFGVQLLISEDATFTNFYPHCHLPLHVLLGKPVYLELRLSSPQPAATLLVHYCVAYPRSATSALILLFEGCPNPLDSGSTSILYVKHLPQNRYQRRFEIKAFQFMDLSTNKYINEEIYFMCSTEVCMPSVSPCAETCFDGKSS